MTRAQESGKGRQALAKMLALAMLFAQALPVPMISPDQALFELYGIGGICSGGNRSPTGWPAQKCDACCWGHCAHSGAALPAQTPRLPLPSAWSQYCAASPTARVGDRRILTMAQARAPPSRPNICHA